MSADMLGLNTVTHSRESKEPNIQLRGKVHSMDCKPHTIVIAEKLREERRRRYKYWASLDQQNLRLDLSRSVLVWSETSWSLCKQNETHTFN